MRLLAGRVPGGDVGTFHHGGGDIYWIDEKDNAYAGIGPDEPQPTEGREWLMQPTAAWPQGWLWDQFAVQHNQSGLSTGWTWVDMEGGQARPVPSVADAQKPAMARRLLRLEGKKKKVTPKAEDTQLVGVWEQYHIEEEDDFRYAGRDFYRPESSHCPVAVGPPRGGDVANVPGVAGLGMAARMPDFVVDTPLFSCRGGFRHYARPMAKPERRYAQY